jgi:hypothetical protein
LSGHRSLSRRGVASLDEVLFRRKQGDEKEQDAFSFWLSTKKKKEDNFKRAKTWQRVSTLAALGPASRRVRERDRGVYPPSGVEL